MSQPSRSQVVEHYRKVLADQGSAGLWAALWDRHFVCRMGELHAPEFAACMECGQEFEVQTNGQGRALGHLSEFCHRCRQAHRAAVAALKAQWPQLERVA